MPENMGSSNDPIINAVKRLNTGYQNTEYSIKRTIKLGDALVHTVTFKGEDGWWHDNYVYEKGNVVIAYWDVERMLTSKDNDLIPSGRDSERLRLIMVGAITAVLLLTVIGIVIYGNSNPNLQILTGLLGTGFGYLVGKVPEQKK